MRLSSRGKYIFSHLAKTSKMLKMLKQGGPHSTISLLRCKEVKTFFFVAPVSRQTFINWDTLQWISNQIH